MPADFLSRKTGAEMLTVFPSCEVKLIFKVACFFLFNYSDSCINMAPQICFLAIITASKWTFDGHRTSLCLSQRFICNKYIFFSDRAMSIF